MVVTGKDVNGREFTTILDSIDCSKSITLLDHYAVNKNTEITFTYTVNGNVDSVVDRGGVQSLTLSTGIKLPHESEITFEKGNASFTITKQPNNGTLTERTQSCLYTPAPNFVGKDTVKFTGANKNAGEYATAQTSEERTIFITVK